MFGMVDEIQELRNEAVELKRRVMELQIENRFLSNWIEHGLDADKRAIFIAELKERGMQSSEVEPPCNVPIRNQGSYATSVAHSATTALELANALAVGHQCCCPRCGDNLKLLAPSYVYCQKCLMRIEG
jgi:hypothetical protein